MQAPLPGRPAVPPPLAAIAASAVRLPNGLEVRCVSRRDVRFLYNEVWDQQAYLKVGRARAMQGEAGNGTRGCGLGRGRGGG